MKLANVGGRATLVVDGGGLDVATASSGRFGPDPQELFDDWAAFTAWAATAAPASAGAATVAPASAGTGGGGAATAGAASAGTATARAATAGAASAGATSVEGASASGDLAPLDPAELDAPVPRPRQVIAIGVNYTEHAAEAGYPDGSMPITFTKFPSSIVGASHLVALPEGNVDWEVELVVAISREAHGVAQADAWDFIAGVTIGQDLSERLLQNEGSKPQFSLGKSHTGFGPTGPWLVTPDELPNRDDLAIGCALDGEQLQSGRTSAMIYTVPILIERLSAIITLYPGDIIFTGTPAGVGNARTPKRFVAPGQTLVSSIEGIGELVTRFAPEI